MGKIVILATCSLNQLSIDFENNFQNILKSIEIAKEKKATYRIGPELEICGYGCNDHFFEGDTLLHSFQILAKLLLSPICQNIICDVGMPIMHKNVTYNCRVIFLNRKIILIHPKMKMADGFNYRESRWFTAWSKHKQIEDFYLPGFIRDITGQLKVPIGDGIISTLDTCIGNDICEEMWSPLSRHIEMGLDGVEIFANSSGSHHELRKAYVRVDLIKSASMKSGGVYMFSNFLGCDGERVYYDGSSAIAINGNIVAQGSQFTFKQVEVLTAAIDLDEIRSYKNELRSRCIMSAATASFPRVQVYFSLSSEKYLDVSPTIDWTYHSPEQEISLGPAIWLWDYLRRSSCSGFLLPLSGGIDSCSTACIVASMCHLVFNAITIDQNEQVLEDLRSIVNDDDYMPINAKDLCNRIFVTCYMATSNSSQDTKQRASDFANEIGSYHIAFNFDGLVTNALSIFSSVFNLTPKYKVYGGSNQENVAMQNIQARLRMVLAYLFAQLTLWGRGSKGSLLVLASANVDESLRGYMTKYDCSSADLNPIGGISKNDLKKFILYCSIKFGYKSLTKIVNAPPTAELEPLIEGKIIQEDEADMGMTYDELSVYGQLRIKNRLGPYGMYAKLLALWKDKYTAQQIAEKVKHFFRCYAMNRHKMTILTPSYHAEWYSPDDNRYDMRQFLYNCDWTFQFQCIDHQMNEHHEID